MDAAVLLNSDGFYEDAVSGVYCAMFYAARALLVSEGIVVKTHRGTITKIGELC
ncbi:HEPN domain-containing protein [Methanospirillum stamsii]|uniref:HEPN domain-containing protein n=1 Tax=Methanospirillum stamsii TaxID=1277351 RepID=UPI001FE6D58C|nr:HEPN domain-containing protein [Methanospirillum stamsii]